MFDAHCHIDLPAFDADRPQALARATQTGVRGVLIAGIGPDGWDAQVRVARAWPGAVVSYGVHPQLVAEVSDEEAQVMVCALTAALAAASDPDAALPRPAALGETGLDRSPRSPPESLPRQTAAFRAQLRLAREHDLPVVLHILRAHEAALDLLAEEGLPGCGGVVHSYSGPAELVDRYVELGLYLSMAGTVTLPGARRPLLAAAAIPRDRLLVETDAPDQSPAGHRGTRNEPAFLPEIIHAVASARGERPEDVARWTEDNARRLYRL